MIFWIVLVHAFESDHQICDFDWIPQVPPMMVLFLIFERRRLKITMMFVFY